MDDDPTGLKAEGGNAEDERSGGLSMKIKAKAKYDHLVRASPSPLLWRCPALAPRQHLALPGCTSARPKRYSCHLLSHKP